MEIVSTVADGDQNLDPPSGELVRLLAELIRAGWQLHFEVIPNGWRALSQAEIIFEPIWNSDPPRTLQEEFEALKHGLPPEVSVHWKFDPFDPQSIYKAVKRFHHLFVENSREP